MPELSAIQIADRIQMRKPHPCGGDVWQVERVGAELGLRCETCGRKLFLPRSEVARRMRRVLVRA